jgi:hypothetical protein
MDVTLLRTLTKKSIIWFGQYGGMSVEQIIHIQKSNYLRWLYYNASKVNFVDEILEELRIYPSWRIPKPGTNNDMFVELGEVLHSAIHCSDPERYFKMKSRSKRISKGRYMERLAKFKKYYRNNYLQAKNHGH